MSGNNKKDNSIEEQVARISGNFESDILRLIKTQSMIKTSSGIIGEEIKYLGSKTKLIQDKLDELNVKTSELNDFLQVSFQDKDISTTHVGLYLNEFISSITKENNEINSIKQELADRLKNGSEKLNFLHKFYIAELEAFQQEVDSGLSNIREEIKEKMDEELNLALVEDIDEEVEEINEEVEEEPLEQIENEEEYYLKMFASNNAQNGEQELEDKFLYIALGFLLLCAVGFLGYYFKYIRLNTPGEMVVLEELYNQDSQKEIEAELLNNNTDNDAIPEVENKGTKSRQPVSQSMNVKPSELEEYILSESGTSNPSVFKADFNHTVVVKRANVRNGPGKNYGIVSVLSNGTSVALLDENMGIWTKIKLLDGREGWVAKRLITK
jgi:hypothetical protein